MIFLFLYLISKKSTLTTILLLILIGITIKDYFKKEYIKENDEEVEGPEDENVEFLGKAPKKKETRVTYFRKYLQPNIIIYLRSPIAKTKQKVYKSRERRLRITVTVPGQNIEYRNRK